MLGVDVCEFGGQVLELLWLTMCYRGLMADKKDLPIEEEEDERNLNYNPPAQKSLEEIQKMDEDDESLVKYKQTLLGTVPITTDLSGSNVQVTRLTLLCDEAPAPLTMDLTDTVQCVLLPDHAIPDIILNCDFSALWCPKYLQALKEKTLVLKEGVTYRLKIDFKVNREIVAGLKYNHVIHRKGIKVNKVSHMVGSYGPKAEEHEFVGPVDETPKGLMSRGHYGVHSRFIDDDKNIYLDWEWNFDVKKDWDQ